MKIKRRNLFVQVLLMTVTCGLYSVYWYYWTTRELLSLQGRDEENVIMWTILFCIPGPWFYSYYKQGQAYEALTGGELNRWITVILWFFFSPAVWLVIQRRLNEIAVEQERVALAGATSATSLSPPI